VKFSPGPLMANANPYRVVYSWVYSDYKFSLTGEPFHGHSCTAFCLVLMLNLFSLGPFILCAVVGNGDGSRCSP